MRFRRHIRGQVGPHRTPRPDHDGMVAATAAAAHCLFEPRFSPLGNNHRVARNEQGCFRQWAAQLRSGASAARGVARLFALLAGRRRAALSRAARLRRGRSQVPLFPDDDGMAEDSGQDRDKQRGILPSLSPSARGHGRAASADQGHGPYYLPACRGTAVVRRSIRPR